jgi:tetratricopeptide (TPR) repeat protein
MPYLRHSVERIIASLLLSVIVAFVLSAQVDALGQQQRSDELKSALEFYEASNFVAALPLLEKAAAANPDDPFILSRLGFTLYASSAVEKDVAPRKRIRERARQVLLKSQSRGDDSSLTKITLDALSQNDETIIPYSTIQAAEAAVRQGEAAFVQGDMDKAIAAYTRALELDPKLYEAALYAGDSEFKKAYKSTDPQYRNEHFEQAGVWFAKAIAIDPNRETAYRYWGDALDLQGKSLEARDKFVDAIIAEPYDRRPYVGLTQWAERHKVPMAHPKIDIPSNVSSTKPGEVKITVNDLALKGGDNDGSAAWLMYGIARAGWMDKKEGRSEKFSKAYPGETVYRHSLAEEVDALRLVADSVSVQMKDKKVTQLNPSLASLVKLKDASLLEAYVLFARPDEGIARDYSYYRSANRDKLKRYWLEVVITNQQ